MGRMILSICAVVVAVGLGASQSADPVGKQGSRQGSPAERQEPAQGQAESTPPSVEDSLQRIARNVEASQAEAQAQEPENGAKRDLKAQEDMALWAMWMFGAAALTTIISGFGVFLIWRTLIHTRTAAQAGADIVTVTRDSAERQLRAYLVLDSFEVSRMTVGETPKLSATLKNVGSTPANGVRVVLKLLAAADPETLKVKNIFNQKVSTRAQIGPGSCGFPTDDAARALTQADLTSYRNGEWGFLVLAYVTYRDVFRRTRRTLVTGVVRPNTAITSEGILRVVAADRGSRAT